MTTLHYRKDGVFRPFGSGPGGGCPPPAVGEVPFPIAQPAINLVSDALSRSELELQENSPNWSPFGSLQIAIVMWRAPSSQVNYWSVDGTYPFELYAGDALELGLEQRLHVYTRIKPDFHRTPHRFQGPNARCAGAIVNFPNGNRWQIRDIRSSSGNGTYNNITTVRNRVNLVAGTWLHNNTFDPVDQDIFGRDSFFVRETKGVLPQSRLHLGFVTGETVVRSYNNLNSIADPPNHGSICISLTYT